MRMPEFVVPRMKNVARVLLAGKGVVVFGSGDILRTNPVKTAAGAADPVVRLGVGEAHPEGELLVARE